MPVVDLDQAIDRAVEHNPALKSARYESASADALREQAALRPNPTLSVDHQRVPGGNRANGSSLSIPLELGGKRQARIDAADAWTRAVGAELDERRAQLRADVIRTYFDVLAAQDRVDLARASIATADRATDVARRRVQAGRVSPVDEARARAAEASARIEFGQAETDLAVARQRLAALWGETGPAPFIARLPSAPPMAAVDAAEVATRGPAPAPTTADAASASADATSVSTNAAGTSTDAAGISAGAADAPPAPLLARIADAPPMRRARAQIDQRRAQWRLERSRAIPETALTLGTATLIENGWRTNQIGVSVSVPIFDRNQGAIRDASVRTSQAMQEAAAIEHALRAELMQSWTRWRSAQRQIALAREGVVERGARTLEATTRGFELGKFSFLDVLDAQRTLFAGRAQLLRATAEAWQARADIERLLGGPVSDPVVPSAMPSASAPSAVPSASAPPSAR
ncbi:MAG: TolC family protein [Burkholderiaceae bacterium]